MTVVALASAMLAAVIIPLSLARAAPAQTRDICDKMHSFARAACVKAFDRHDNDDNDNDDDDSSSSMPSMRASRQSRQTSSQASLSPRMQCVMAYRHFLKNRVRAHKDWLDEHLGSSGFASSHRVWLREQNLLRRQLLRNFRTGNCPFEGQGSSAVTPKSKSSKHSSKSSTSTSSQSSTSLSNSSLSASSVSTSSVSSTSSSSASSL